jgi:Protein of unknown function (DUF2608)
MLKNLFILYCLSFFSLIEISAEIIEVHHIHEVNHYLQPDTLIVFDIDNTLLECRQTFGSDQWFGKQIQKLQTQGIDANTALAQALAHWIAIQHTTHLQLVDPQSPDLVKELQQIGYPVMALTTRGTEVAAVTIEQLKQVNIDMKPTAPLKDKGILQHANEESAYQEGILFTSGGHKGEALATYLKCANHQPKRIVFINDKHSHLLPVEEMAHKQGIEFIGLRYSKTDARVKSYRQEIAEIQQEFYGKILTDEAAEAIWHSRQFSLNAKNNQ